MTATILGMSTTTLRRPTAMRRVMRRRPPRPIWSVRTLTWLGLATTAIVTSSVFVFGHRAVMAETEIAVAIIAGLLFLLLAIGLYRGARIRKDEPPPSPTFPDCSPADIGSPDIGDVLGGVDDLVGLVVGLVLAIVVGLLLIFLLPLLLNGGVFVVSLLGVGCFWIFHRALRQVFIRGPACRGRLAKSLSYALAYTLLYTGWLLAVLLVVDRLHPTGR